MTFEIRSQVETSKGDLLPVTRLVTTAAGFSLRGATASGGIDQEKLLLLLGRLLGSLLRGLLSGFLCHRRFVTSFLTVQIYGYEPQESNIFSLATPDFVFRRRGSPTGSE